MLPSSRGPGHRPLTAATGVRIPLGVLELRRLPRPFAIDGNCEGFFFFGRPFGLLRPGDLIKFSDSVIYSVKLIARISRLTTIDGSRLGPAKLAHSSFISKG